MGSDVTVLPPNPFKGLLTAALVGAEEGAEQTPLGEGAVTLGKLLYEVICNHHDTLGLFRSIEEGVDALVTHFHQKHKGVMTSATGLATATIRPVVQFTSDDAKQHPTPVLPPPRAISDNTRDE